MPCSFGLSHCIGDSDDCVVGTRFRMSQQNADRVGFALVALGFGSYYIITAWLLVTQVPEPVAKAEGQVGRGGGCCCGG